MTLELETVPVCDLDFYSEDTIHNPWPLYRAMLELGPVCWLSTNRLYAVTHFKPLTEVLRNHQVFQSGKGVSVDDSVNKMLIGSTLNSDPPIHDQTRSITFKPLTPKALEDVRGRITLEAEKLADHVVAEQEFDAAIDLAPHLPLTIVRDLVGLGNEGRNNMLKWGAATFELIGDPKQRRSEAISDLKQMRTFLEDPYTLNKLDQKGWAQHATNAGIAQGMAPDRAAELMRDYIAPSLDTTISAIGYAVYLFAKYPEQWRLLKRDRTLLANAVEEVVRFNSPIRAFSRFVAEDTTVANHRIPLGSRVMMVFAAANRDPSRFPDPDRFDITRNVRGHVGFGHGVHACLGMHLARLEIQCLFSALLDRVDRFELTDAPQIAINSSIHAYRSIPIRAVPIVSAVHHE